MKITLNSSIPEARRPQVDALVKTLVRASEIVWLPSRFPRLVMLVEPGANPGPEPEAGSIFESPRSSGQSFAAVTEFLEERIKLFLNSAK